MHAVDARRLVGRRIKPSTCAIRATSCDFHLQDEAHPRIKLLFVRELIDSNQLTIKHINGLVNPADMLGRSERGRLVLAGSVLGF